jgi:tetratricopeptide (TPR) repeat protein
MKTLAQNKHVLFSLLLLLLLGLAYSPVYYAGFIWDDPDYVTENPTLRSLGGLYDIWFTPKAIPQYYPLVHTSFWIEYQLWGLNPLGYHITNILLHFLGSLVVYRILRHQNIPCPELITLIFALHPVQVESVAWITERKNLLSLLFYMLSLFHFLQFMQNEQKRGKYFLSLGFFLAALLSKTTACSLPAAILVIEWWKEGRLRLKSFSRLIPFFILGVVMALITILVEKYHVGAQGDYFDYSFLDRILIAGRAVCFYFSKIIWPTKLYFFYPLWKIDSSDVLQYLYPAVVLSILIISLFLCTKKIRSPLAVSLLYIGTLFPALGFVNVYPMRFSLVADHFQHLALVYPIVFICSLIFKTSSSRLVLSVASSVILVLGYLTYEQSKIYLNEMVLYEETLKANPKAWIAWNNLAAMHAKQGDFEIARGHFERAIELNPTYVEAHFNISAIHQHQGNPVAAEDTLQHLLKLYPENPKVVFRVGQYYEGHRKFKTASRYYARALELDPQSERLRNYISQFKRKFSKKTPTQQSILGADNKRPE